MRGPRKRATYNLPTFRPEDWDRKEQRTEYEHQNDQEQKGDFRQQPKEESEYLGRERSAARGKHEVKAGWLIPAVLEQQLNSDLPGLIRALVRENANDTVTGKYILIPAGSTLVLLTATGVAIGIPLAMAAGKGLESRCTE